MEAQQYLERINQRQMILGRMNENTDDNSLDFGVTIHSINNPQYPGYTIEPLA